MISVLHLYTVKINEIHMTFNSDSLQVYTFLK